MLQEKKLQQIQLIDRIQSNNEEIFLCIQVVDGENIAVGCKDGTLELYRLLNKIFINTQSIKVHQGSICSLGVYNHEGIDYVMTGSDHQESEIGMLEISKEGKKIKSLKGHEAAIVSIKQRGKLLISGSYDQSVIIWDVQQNIQLQRLCDASNSISTLIIIDSTLITTDLDSNLHFYSFQQTSLFLLTHSQQHSCFICVINYFLHMNKPILILGDKKGNVSLLDLDTQNTIKTYNYSHLGAVLEILVVQLQNDVHIISLHQSNDIIITNFLTSVAITLSKLDHHAFIEFGCGVDSKMQFITYNDSSVIVAVNQSKQNKSLSFLKLITN